MTPVREYVYKDMFNVCRFIIKNAIWWEPVSR